MITLIPLRDATPYYSYNLIINDQPNFIEVNRNEGPKKKCSQYNEL